MRPDLDPAHFDVMEVWYRRWNGLGSDNQAAYDLWNDFWRRGRRILGVAARDWHGPEQDGDFPGELPFTGVFADDNTPIAILRGMKAGRVIMSGGPVLDLTIDTMGGLVADLARLDADGELRVLRDGEVVHTAPAKEGTTRLPGPLAKGAWRAEVWADDSPRVITNHVVVGA